MGMLIGEPDYRGKGVAAEVLLASARWLTSHRKIKQIVLGVSKDNAAAIRAYEKVGFVQAATEIIPDVPSDAMTMVWDLSQVSHSAPMQHAALPNTHKLK
jgi:RimJ/RimL family protein N-acetyltransferase